jgi:hypothetical protein
MHGVFDSAWHWDFLSLSRLSSGARLGSIAALVAMVSLLQLDARALILLHHTLSDTSGPALIVPTSVCTLVMEL